MKLKKYSIIIILAGLCMMSCRENYEVIDTQTNQEESLLKLSRKGTDSLASRDSIPYSTNPPKDPPVTGTNWRAQK